MPQITLHYLPGACSLVPHILLHEINAQFTLEEEQKDFSPEFLQLNPKAKVPVLVVDDEVITENIAVITTISNMAPDLHLMGQPGTLEAVRVLEWMSWLATSLHATGLSIYFRPFRFTESNDESAHEDMRKRATKLVKDCFLGIESKLSGVHAIGDRLTAVDALLYFYYSRGVLIWSRDAADRDFPKYSKLAKAVADRQATIQACKEEGIQP